jgi:hypothetical protein
MNADPGLVRPTGAPVLDVRCRWMLVEAFAAAGLHPLVPVAFTWGPSALETYLRAHPDQVSAARRALADCRDEARHHVGRYFGWRQVPDDPAAAWSLEDLIEQLRHLAGDPARSSRERKPCFGPPETTALALHALRKEQV